MPSQTRQRSIIAHHLILTLYGHWLPNDPRGSGSTHLVDPKLASLGDVHTGRRLAPEQPSRGELRDFHERAEALLNFPRFWFNEAKRQACGDAFTDIIAQQRYTCYACAILSNHAHLVIRVHRDRADAMMQKLQDASAKCLRLRFMNELSAHHPIWNARPYVVFLYTPEEVRTRISYVRENPGKEGLPSQTWPFTMHYNGWPLHKQFP